MITNSEAKMYEDCKINSKKRGMLVGNTSSLRQILDYLEKNLKKGYKLDDLKYVLFNQGYMRIEVEEAIKIISEKIKKAQGDKHKVVEEVQIIEEVAELPKKGFFRRLFGR